MPKRLILISLLTVSIALPATITFAAPLDNQAPCDELDVPISTIQLSDQFHREAFDVAMGRVSSLVMKARLEERRMWKEYGSATTPKALRDWARKYKVTLISPTEMVTKRTITKQRRGRVRAGSGCRDSCGGGFTDTHTQTIGTGVRTITSVCKLSTCHSVCSCCPKKDCNYTCNYTCKTTAKTTF